MGHIIQTNGYNYVSIADKKTGKTKSNNIFAYAEPGGGKSTLLEYINYYKYIGGGIKEKRATIIGLNDKKDEYEMAFSMFEPDEEYHITKLNKYGVPKKAIPTILHHPYSEDIPFEKELPPMHIFTIDIKSIDRPELNFLAETNENKTSIQIIEKVIKELKPYEGILHLNFYAQNETDDTEKDLKSKIRFRSMDERSGFPKTKMGTAKQSMDIQNYLQPFFNEDYIITPHNCPLNIDIVKIANDQEHYHSFIFKYLKDERKKLFVMFHIFLEIIKHKDEFKNPIHIYFPELSGIIGNKETGFASYLAELIANAMRTMRTSGIGISADGQTWKYTNNQILSAINEFFIGKITSMDELEAVKTKLGLKAKEFELLKSIEIGQFLMITKDEGLDETSAQKIIGFMPPHAHKEESIKFIQLYKKNNLPLTKHTDAKNIIEKTRNEIIKDVKTKVEEENKNKLKKLRGIEEEKERKIKAKIEAETNKIIKKQEQQKEFDIATAKIWKKMYEEEHINLRSIATQYNTNHMAIKRAIDKLKEIEKQAQDTNNPPINL